MRWITGHSVYAAHETELVGADPIYRYGIVMEVSPVDPGAIVVHSVMEEAPAPRLVILSDDMDEIELLSSAGKDPGAPKSI